LDAVKKSNYLRHHLIRDMAYPDKFSQISDLRREVVAAGLQKYGDESMKRELLVEECLLMLNYVALRAREVYEEFLELHREALDGRRMRAKLSDMIKNSTQPLN